MPVSPALVMTAGCHDAHQPVDVKDRSRARMRGGLAGGSIMRRLLASS